MDQQRLIPGDPTLIEKIVKYLKAKGIFDEFRHDCLADVDTKSSCQNLSQRIDGYTSKFLANETWHPDLNKNELRNKLRRNLDESGMLAIGADIVVEQVMNPKTHQVILPRIAEVVHQYIKEQTDLLNKKPETFYSDNTSGSDKAVCDTSDSKVKTSVSDPIADILSFAKSKPIPVTSAHIKTESAQQKHADFPKVEKKKEDKAAPVIEKNTHETPVDTTVTPVVTESKTQADKEKEKIKKEEQESPQEVSKKAVKEELKPEKKKTEDVKAQNCDTVVGDEESKASVSTPSKSSVIGKKEVDKNKQKFKSGSTQKLPNSSSEIKKPKKELSDKASEKLSKSKPTKSSKETLSPTKTVSSTKSIPKEERSGESSKSKSSDSSSSKTLDSSVKKLSKSSSIKKDSVKQKGHSEKPDKSITSKSPEKSDQSIHSDSTNEKTDKCSKVSKSSDKSDQNIQSDSSSEKTDKSKTSKSSDKSDQNIHYDSSNSEKVTKMTHYSSSYDSSQGSDQEKSSSSSSKKERQKHFYKHAKKEKLQDQSDKKSKTSSDKKRPSKVDESPSKKAKSEKSSKLGKLKDATGIEAAKISSRSNSFGSTSSVSSSSNASKDNLASTSDEVSECSVKDKKKKQSKEKDSCQNPAKELPPPPPPPPSSSSLLCELASSADGSSVEDTQSSSASESSSSESMSDDSSSSDLESKDSISNTLNESTLTSSSDHINDFYDIFLYSSSSSEFESFDKSPEKKKKDELLFPDAADSDVSVSSVHTSDLSSYDDELSDDDFSSISELHTTGRKRLTVKEAQELLRNRAALNKRNKNSPIKSKSDSTPVALNDKCVQKSSVYESSDEESTPSEPVRSLRRERKLNPRYASSEYTSIFNSRKETFITKQSTPVKSNSCNSSPNSETKCGRKEVLSEKGKLPKKTALEAKMNAVHQGEVEKLQKTKNILQNSESFEEKEHSDVSAMSSADEMDSIIIKKIHQENDKHTDSCDNDHLKNHIKLKPQNNSKLNRNSYSLKRKLPFTESTAVKRPCSRSSVDSTSSEFVPNENKPFNNEKKSMVEDKILRDGKIKASDLTDEIKKDLFGKQRTNNNGDILGQKDIFPKNLHGKAINIAEKKTSESETSKELNAL